MVMIAENIQRRNLSGFSIVIPVLNEGNNITFLIREIALIMTSCREFEVIVVDDHSKDKTADIVQQMQREFSWLRLLCLREQNGQSAALWYGVWNASYPLIVTMDGDGQNDPADIPCLLDTCVRMQKVNRNCLVNGWRSQRKDSVWRRFSSNLANQIRGWILQDEIPDSGCGIKAFPKDTFLALPAFTHMHRFLPALIRQRGGNVESIIVNHRPRKSGYSHYGTLDRLLAGIVDLFGVLWLGKRAIQYDLIRYKDHE